MGIKVCCAPPAVYERLEKDEEGQPASSPVNTISPPFPFMPTLCRRGSTLSLASTASDSNMPTVKDPLHLG